MLDTKYVTKIVVTGGPCSGRSTALAALEKAFAKMGYYVVFIERTADSLRNTRATPELLGSEENFVRMQMQLQQALEKIYEADAHYTPHRKILLICDGGIMDGKAELDEAEFGEILASEGWDEVQLRDAYDAVFHLVTAAKGARGYYHGECPPEEAVRLDDGLISAWTGQPHFRVVGNETRFDEKIGRLVREVASFLGVPEPMEIERKYLIEYPDIAWLKDNPHCEAVEITQTYLRCSDGEELRIRRRGADGSYVYFETVKRDLTNAKRVETERRLTKAEYDELLEAAEHPLTIEKTRYCLTYDNQYLEIDVYPFWDNQATLEVEFPDELQEVRFPPEIKVIKDITDDPAYRNSALAKEYGTK